MARPHYVKTSRKPHTCTTYLAPSHEIPAGQPYFWAAPGFRGRDVYRCTQHPFQPSELTTSLVGEPLRAQEDAHRTVDAATTLDDLEQAIEDFAAALEQYVQARQDSLDAWEHGNSQLEELVEQAQEALDAVEGQWQPDDYDGDLDENDEPVDADAWQDYFEDQQQAAHDLIDEAPLG